MVVDDDPFNISFMVDLLSEQGYRVRPSLDPHLAQVSAQQSPPDLFLIDVMMPGMNGFELCHALKGDERTKDIPVIFISAVTDEASRVRAFQEGGVDFIAKPVQTEEMLARISTQLSLSALQRDLEQQVAIRTEALVSEIVERKRAEKELQRNNTLLSCMDQLHRDFIDNPDPFYLYNRALTRICELTACRQGFFAEVVMENKHPVAQVFAQRGELWPPREADSPVQKALIFKDMNNLFGEALSKGEAVFSNEAILNPWVCARPGDQLEIPSFLGIPIHHGQELVGELGLIDGEKGFNDEIVTMIGPITRLLGQIISARRDREARLKAELQLRQLATTDPLTGIANRRQLEIYFPPLLSRGRRYGESLTLMIFDIDHFKQVNDNFGHHAGDQLLTDLVGLVQQQIRDVDLFVRWGGDEFLILMPKTTRDEAKMVAERIRTEIAGHPFEQELRVTLSMGLSELHAHDLDDLIGRGDEALYRAKKQGRNQVISN
jgi:diguanylate cyclase (GGDEF)-like protein